MSAPDPTTANRVESVIVDQVVKTYGHGHSAVTALREVTFRIRDGERVALLGKSGSGKSTLLNILGGLDKPSSGTVRIAGKDFATMSARQMAEYRLSTVGMIFQAYNLISSQTALRNVELPMVFSRIPPKERRRAAVEALRVVGLEQRQFHRPSELSGGEQQRVAIARALMNRPRILLADEPTGNLDTKTAREIVRLLTDFLSESGTTFILVTHDEHLAEEMADRVLRMQDGRLTE